MIELVQGVFFFFGFSQGAVNHLQPAAGRSSGEDDFTSSILLILFNCMSHV